MFEFGVLVLKLHLACGLYLTMTDIQLTIPSDKSKLPPSDHRLLTLIAKQTKRPGVHNNLRFSLNGTDKYIQIYPPGGDVLLTPTFFQSDIKKLAQVSATACVEDTIDGDRDFTSLAVNVFPLDNLDCDKILEEICYWTKVAYRIEEDAEATELGPLTSPYIAEMCPYYSINYTTASGDIQLIPPTADRNFWSVGTPGPLTYSVNALSASVNCIIENRDEKEKGSVRQIARDLKIVIIDVDNNPPVPQYDKIIINMSRQYARKGSSIQHSPLIFTDQDNIDVNNYQAVVTGVDGEEEDLLQPICNKHRDTRDGKNQTAIHCSLVFTRDKLFQIGNHSFILQLNDTTMKSHKAKGVVKLPLHLRFSYSPASLTKQSKLLNLYPENLVKIFRTAAPFARVTQPDYLKGSTNFALADITTNFSIFDITKDEGIIYVHHFLGLKKSPEFVSLNVSWTRNNQREYDVIQVRIINEPNKTCGDMNDFNDWIFCSEFGTSNECLRPSSCAISTGGAPSVATRNGPERCMWRGDKTSSNITHLYSTCTPDTKTCPDGTCDSLESLHTLICPQDCTKDVTFPVKKNPKTGRGIDEASGVVVCNDLDRCTIFIPKKRTKDRNKESSKSKKLKNDTTASAIPLPEVQPNISRHNGNFTMGKFLGVDIAKCGTICILGIVGGTFFLGSAIALVVICWRLDRVNKAVREKHNEEHHEMTAPLSLSIPRNISTEPLPLSFQMATTLTDASSMNIISKYTPDPKWEFPRSQLSIEQTLGEGEFGRVLRAKAMNISGQAGYTTVAVKTLKDDAREAELNDLLSEYQLLKEVSHANVIRLLGVCTSPGGPVYLIIEYAEYGSLRNYLRRSRHLKSENPKLSYNFEDNEIDYDEPKLCKVTPKEILSFAWQICNGMAYLSDIKLVHRDLAARNVLLAADKICKISDFGLTRDVYEDNAYFKRSKGRVPVKWMAPESLADHVYTTKSDVWSFGILIWELVSLGATPYPGIAVQNLFHLLKQGYRMERPDNCSTGLYKIMRQCWHNDPNQRPSFQELAGCWEKLLEDKMDYTDLSGNAIINREYFGVSIEDKEENILESNSEDISPLNYLSRAQSYEKCGATDKNLDNEVEAITQNDINLVINTQGYETPVKVPRKVKTPTNEEPEDYTDMGGKGK